MEEIREDDLHSAKVRDLVFAFERHTSSVEPLESHETRHRSKSIGNALSYKLFRQPNLDIHSLVDIEKELVKIEAHLNYYEVYDKETHVAFQEQLFNILTYIVSIDPEEHECAIQKKQNLILETQKLAKILNSKLPYDGNHSYRGVRKTYSNVVRRQEAVVSTTSVRTQQHRAILSTSTSGGFKSEESLDSIKDSVDVSSMKEDDASSIDGRPESTSPPPQKQIVSEPEPSYVPSVSKLKKFFSFRRDNRSEMKVIPAAYSGVSRSHSLNLKSSKYTVFKRKEVRKREAISENEEEDGNIGLEGLVTSSPIQNTNDETGNVEQAQVEISLYIEPEQRVADEHLKVNLVNKEEQHNVSVSKLKSLFEDKQKENIEGNYMNFTGLLRNVDIKKKVDINKSKSMSDLKLEGFRDENETNGDLSREIDDNDEDDFEHVSIYIGKDIQETNNNEVKEEEIKAAINHLSEKQVNTESSETFIIGKVDFIKKNFENLGATSTSTEHRNEEIRHLIHRTIEPIPNPKSNSAEPILKVPIQLRTGLAYQLRSEKIEERTSETSTETVYHVESASNEAESVLKVPIQLRIGLVNESQLEGSQIPETINHETNETQQFEESTFQVRQSNTEAETVHQIKVEENVMTGTVEALKQTFEAIPNSKSNSAEPVLKVPIQLKTDLAYHHSSEKIEDRTSETNIDTVHHVESGLKEVEPVLKVPIQLRIGLVNESLLEESQETVNHETRETQQSEESALQVEESNAQAETVHQIKVEENITTGTVEALKQTFEHLSITTNTIEETNEDIKQVIHRTVEPISSSSSSEEPILRIPVQLRIGVLDAASEEDQEYTRASQQDSSSSSGISVSTGSVENLRQSYEISNESSASTISSESNVSVNGVVEEIKKDFETSNESSETNISTEHHVSVSTDALEVLTHNFESSTESSSSNVSAEHQLSSISTDAVQNLKHSFEISTESTEGSNESAERNVNVSTSNVDELKNNFESSKEDGSKSSTFSEETVNISTGHVEVLKQTFETLSRTNSQDNTDDVKAIVHRTIESIENKNDPTSEPVLKVPIQMRIGFTNSEDVVEKSVAESVHVSQNEESSGTTVQKVTIERKLIKSPIELRINDNVVTYDTNINGSLTSSVPITLYNSHLTAESSSEENGTLTRTQTEEKTQNAITILESPTAYSTLVSSSSPSQNQQVSSSSKLSVSYSQKTSVQHSSSTHVAQRIVSSSSISQSSQLSSQKFLHILKNSSEHSSLSTASSDISTEDDPVTIEEIEEESFEQKPKINLNVSQENIIDEILNDSDIIENVDEEFEKMLQENR